jgi:hypothetical protein
LTESIFHYAVHGLVVRANRELDFLSPMPAGEPQLTLRLDPLELLRRRRPDLPWADLERDAFADPAYAYWSAPEAGLGAVMMRSTDPNYLIVAILAGAGDTIELGWSGPAHISEADLEHAALAYLLPSLLGLALRLAGRLVLHGNAVRVGDRTIAWVGGKGAGKSTLAAAFVNAGYPLLSDDQVTLWPTPSGYAVAPGIRRIRLWPDSMPALAAVAEQYPLHRRFDESIKGYVAVDGPADPQILLAPVPLHTVYVLQPRSAGSDRPIIETPGMATRLHLALSHCIARRILPLPELHRVQEFTQVADLVRQVPLRLLQLPDDLNRLPEVVQVLANEVTNG